MIDLFVNIYKTLLKLWSNFCSRIHRVSTTQRRSSVHCNCARVSAPTALDFLSQLKTIFCSNCGRFSVPTADDFLFRLRLNFTPTVEQSCPQHNLPLPKLVISLNFADVRWTTMSLLLTQKRQKITNPSILSKLIVCLRKQYIREISSPMIDYWTCHRRAEMCFCGEIYFFQQFLVNSGSCSQERSTFCTWRQSTLLQCPWRHRPPSLTFD